MTTRLVMKWKDLKTTDLGPSLEESRRLLEAALKEFSPSKEPDDFYIDENDGCSAKWYDVDGYKEISFSVKNESVVTKGFKNDDSGAISIGKAKGVKRFGL